MHMVAIGWLWVVFMMAITEKNVVAGVMTFLLWGLAPCLLLVYWLTKQGRERRRHAAWLREREQNEDEAARAAEPPAGGPAP
ncbi:MAG TPA: hypothetical protein VH105_21190 [Burkholderiales bacterium]|jgi:biotin transporter BioY|nr:hypothetical protein [Burkholderiales bacterium]